MDVFTRSLYVRIETEVGGETDLSNSSKVECATAENVDADTSIPEILGINIAVWLVSSQSVRAIKTQVQRYAVLCVFPIRQCIYVCIDLQTVGESTVV